ncbi:MAG: type II toxin-antitoxin system VapB family antitoxin [Fimbriimonadaceae bacterium]|nr:type II toxin-antitoxin system VapB family antitoxin [Fimbriimonadaceae bacterium]
MGLNIKNPEVERLISEVAAKTGETKTATVRRAMLLLKEQVSPEASSGERRLRLKTFLEEHWRSLPAELLGRTITKEEREEYLGYGPDGV